MNNIDAQKALERSYVSSIENTEYDEALKLAEMLCLLDPNNPEYSHKIAYVYLKELKWEEAIEAELKTLELDAQYIPALDLLAHAYGGIGNWERSGFYGNLALELKDKAIPFPTQEICSFSGPGKTPSWSKPFLMLCFIVCQTMGTSILGSTQCHASQVRVILDDAVLHGITFIEDVLEHLLKIPIL